MKIVTWNINGIRTFKNAIKKNLDSFDADIICVQETKVTRKNHYCSITIHAGVRIAWHEVTVKVANF